MSNSTFDSVQSTKKNEAWLSSSHTCSALFLAPRFKCGRNIDTETAVLISTGND